MVTLAILGHETRGKEVIEILEMLGGNNLYNFKGDCESLYYYTTFETDNICHDWAKYSTHSDVYILTLEKFLEKYPYKVGDKVNVCGENAALVIGMRWEIDYIVYRVRLEKNGYETSKIVEELQPYTEQKPLVIKENFYDSPCTGSVRAEEQTYLNPKIEEAKEEIKENLKEAKTIMEETIKIDIPKGYEFVGVDDNNQQVVLERIKPQYPKTYEECCKLLNKATFISFEGISLGEVERYKPYIKLCRCRDAYWKIAGDWKPLDAEEGKTFCIYYNRFLDELEKASGIFDANAILDFPTKEMRDNFFENFKELIEECKELL